MKHRIDPTVDCVFKAILGQNANKDALIHFLNSVIKPEEDSRIIEVTVLNPYNDREFRDDKLTIVDVKAQDEKGNQYQIEIQLDLFPSLKHRILYTWSHMYQSMLKTGEEYIKLKKAVSIWILAKPLFPECKEYHLPFSVYNLQHKILLSNHMQIHVIQLPHWQWQGTTREEIDRWMYLFTQGENVDLDCPPEILKAKEMKSAMETMKRFSENEEDYEQYWNRRMAIMQFNTIKKELREEVTAEVTAQVTAEVTAEMQAKLDKERKEKERLLNLLQQAGIDPGQES